MERTMIICTVTIMFTIQWAANYIVGKANFWFDVLPIWTCLAVLYWRLREIKK